MNLDGFEIRERLGEGSFGVVYRAFQSGPDRDVAVKVIHPRLLDTAEVRTSLVAEAKLIAGLEHPFIVPLHEVIDAEDVALVFRYLDGGTVAHALERGSWRLESATRLVGQLADALEFAHRHGVVHGDVKPSNVLLDGEGNAYLTDFGVARQIFTSQPVDEQRAGTPAYMAPELIEAGEVTTAVDVYSLGILLYELLTGEHPFPASSLEQVLRHQLRSPVPSVLATHPDLSPEIDSVIAKATAKQPDDRFAGPGDMATALRLATESSTAGITRVKRKAALPASVDSFIGRSAELESIAASLETGRLVTLTGPGGAGKTRLATETARRLEGQYRDVWFIDLAVVTGGEEVPEAAVSALGLSQRSPDPTATVVNTLGDDRSLMVVDNCEHVIEAIAELLESVLAGCPNVRVVATSRESLRIRGETVYNVPPLATPDTGVVDAETIFAVESAQLFVERARAADPNFAVPAEDVADLAVLLRRLDGVPLAVELVAAHTRAIPLDRIAASIDEMFSPLAAGSRTALPRHRTMGAAIEWSDRLLTDAERNLFNRLGVLHGSFDLDAAEALNTEGGSMETLSGLLDKSMVSDLVGYPGRFRLLEPLRLFATAKLEAGGVLDEVEALRDAHYRSVAEEMGGGFRLAHEPRWQQRFDADRHHLVRAIEAMRRTDRIASARIVDGLADFWFPLGLFAEGDRVLTQAIEDARDEDPELEASLLVSLGHLLESVDIRARSLLDRARDLAIRHRLPALEARSLNSLASLIAGTGGDLRQGHPYLEQAYELYAEHLPDEAAVPLVNLAWVEAVMGNVARSRARLAEARARVGGDDAFEPFFEFFDGIAARFEGDREAADRLLSRSSEHFRKRRSDVHLALSLLERGIVRLESAEPATAQPLLDEALNVFDDRAGSPKWTLTRGLARLAEAALASNDPSRARELLKEALSESPTDSGWICVIADIAALTTADRRPDEAAALVRIADGIRERYGIARDPFESERADRLRGEPSSNEPDPVTFEIAANAVAASLDRDDN